MDKIPVLNGLLSDFDVIVKDADGDNHLFMNGPESLEELTRVANDTEQPYRTFYLMGIRDLLTVMNRTAKQRQANGDEIIEDY